MVIVLSRIIRNIGFSFVIAMMGAQAFGTSTYFDLERTTASSLKSDLKPLLDGFLLNRLGHPDHPYQLDTAVEIEAGSIQSAKVRVTLNFKEDIPLSIDLKGSVSKFFMDRGYRTSPVLFGDRRPTVRVAVEFSKASSIPEIITIITKLICAFFCLVVIHSLYRKKSRRSTATPSVSSGSGPVPSQRLCGPYKPRGAPLSAQFPKDLSEDKSLLVKPVEGSWYINSLVDLTSNRLSDTFRSIPMAEALTLLNNVPSPYRNHVISKLDLVVPIKKHLKNINSIKKN